MALWALAALFSSSKQMHLRLKRFTDAVASVGLVSTLQWFPRTTIVTMFRGGAQWTQKVRFSMLGIQVFYAGNSEHQTISLLTWNRSEYSFACLIYCWEYCSCGCGSFNFTPHPTPDPHTHTRRLQTYRDE